MANTIRSFLAVEIPLSNKEKILKLINSFNEKSGSLIKWVSKDNLHITLKFIGELNTDHISTIQNSLTERLSSVPAFDIHINGLGVFPNSRKPRIFWLGFDQNKNLERIVSSIENCAVNLGYEADDKPFSPHLTIGRARRDISSGDLIAFTKNFQDHKLEVIPDFKVNYVTLFKSELNREGPLYSQLFRVSLAG